MESSIIVTEDAMLLAADKSSRAARAPNDETNIGVNAVMQSYIHNSWVRLQTPGFICRFENKHCQ